MDHVNALDERARKDLTTSQLVNPQNCTRKERSLRIRTVNVQLFVVQQRK